MPANETCSERSGRRSSTPAMWNASCARRPMNWPAWREVAQAAIAALDREIARRREEDAARTIA